MGTEARPSAADMAAPDVVDAHLHVWRLADLPWLHGPPVARIFGAYEPIRRDYTITEYLNDARPAGIGAAVYVQPNWPLERSVEEVRWVQSVHQEQGWPHAIIGSADMFAPGARAVFERQRESSPLMRGARVQLHWHPDARFRFASAPDRMNDAVFRDNLAALEELGWLFELQVFPGQMLDAAALVAAFPDTTFVLVHAGMLESMETPHVERWRAGLRLLAEHPNVVVKLSGQGTFVHRVDERLIRLVAMTALELFGPERCMFGSNFPIESIWTDIPTLLATWRRVLGALDPTARHNVMADTARRVYSLGPAYLREADRR
jgi:predicted TIM-barrel fold metal-dependent hydrolase